MPDFEDLVEQHAHYLKRVEPAAIGEAGARISAWLLNGVPDLRVKVTLPDCPTRPVRPLAPTELYLDVSGS